MKSIVLLYLFCGMAWISLSQDTLRKYTSHPGFQHLVLLQKGDTTLHTYYPDGTLESIRKSGVKNTVIDKRYYPNGKLMWKQERSNNKANGLMQLYGKDGILLTSLILKNDTVIDTLFSRKNRPVIFGQFTYYSVVHGGAPNQDGRSNISGGSGVRAFAEMYLVQQDSNLLVQNKYMEFFTDQNGYFFSEVERGCYGIFPAYYPIAEVKSTMGSPIPSPHLSVQSHWSQERPIEMNQTNYLYLPLHYHSVGFAP